MPQFTHNTSTSFRVILVYTDDIILIGSDFSYVKKFINLLKSKLLLKDLNMPFFLGIGVTKAYDYFRFS